MTARRGSSVSSMGTSGWLQVSLQVEGEMAEAVAEVLARFAPGGVVIEQAASTGGSFEGRKSTEPVLVYAFLSEDDSLEDSRRRLEEALYFLGRIRPLPSPEFQRVPDQDWTLVWKERYRPVRIGSRLLILPPWIAAEPGSRTVVRIDPGMAFGTGTHPSTQLCLEILDELEPFPGTLIDVGCGSGILAISGLRLGGDFALGVDTDSEAVRAAAENAEINGVEDRFELGVGSANEIQQGMFSVTTAPLVLANILAPVLIQLLENGLARLPEPGGRLILSGMLEEQEQIVRNSVLTAGLEILERRQQGEWVALVAS